MALWQLACRTRLPTPARIAIGLVFLFLLPFGAKAQAQTPAEIHVTAPAPLRGAGNVVVTSQVVDITLTSDEEGRLWAEVIATTKLHNTSKTAAAQVAFGWPTWSGDAVTFSPERGENVQFTRDGTPFFPTPQPLETTWGEETRTVDWWTTTQTIARDARTTFGVSWRQPLGDAPLVTIRVGLLPAARWPGAVNGLRVTVHLPELTAQEQLVRVAPVESLTFDGYRVEWVLAEFEPEANLELTLIAPAFWHQLVELRRQVADSPDDVQAWLDLADRYTLLTAAGILVYDELAEAALLAARDADPSNPEPYRRLWERYHLEVGFPPDPAALQQAAEVAEAYVLAGGTDVGIRAYAVEGFLQLAKMWLAERVPEKALAWVDRAARIASPTDQVAVEAVRERAVDQAVLLTLQTQGLTAAIARAHDLGVPPVEEISLPWAQRVRVLVRTEAERRSIVAEWVNPVVPETVATHLHQTETRLTEQAIPGVSATFAVEGPVARFTLEISGPPDSWPETMARVEGVLPADENLDLLRSVLRPSALEWRLESGWLEERLVYREAVVLQSRAAARAETLRQQAETASWGSLRALLAESAAEWDRLAQAQEVVYTVQAHLSGRLMRSEWALFPPVAQELVFDQAVPRADRLALLIAGGVGLLLLVLALIWRWPVRR